jgi:hypothetical protein
VGSRARLICEIAVATQTAPSQWWDEDAEALATVVELLQKQADATRKATRKGGRRRG